MWYLNLACSKHLNSGEWCKEQCVSTKSDEGKKDERTPPLSLIPRLFSPHHRLFSPHLTPHFKHLEQANLNWDIWPKTLSNHLSGFLIFKYH